MLAYHSGIPHGTVHTACHFRTMYSAPAQGRSSSSGLFKSLGRGAIAGGQGASDSQTHRRVDLAVAARKLCAFRHLAAFTCTHTQTCLCAFSTHLHTNSHILYLSKQREETAAKRQKQRERMSGREKVEKQRETKCRGSAEGIPFGFDRRNKSLQLWAGPCKWGQVTLIIPKFKVFPAHLSQAGLVANRRMASDIDVNALWILVKRLAQAECCLFTSQQAF